MTRLGDNNRYPTRPVTNALADAITCYHPGGRLTGRGGLAIPIAIPTAAQVEPWRQQPNWRNHMS